MLMVEHTSGMEWTSITNVPSPEAAQTTEAICELFQRAVIDLLVVMQTAQ